MDTNWILENYLKKGETLVINSIENRFFETTLYHLTAQIALLLCGYTSNIDVLPVNVQQGLKVLYINNSVENKELLEHLVKILNSDINLIKKYGNLLYTINTKENIFTNTDIFIDKINEVSPDVVIFDNVNNFSEKNDIKKTLSLINKIAGHERTKILTNFFNPVLDFSKYDFLNKFSACSLSVHYSTPRYKYNCLLKSKHQSKEIEFILDYEKSIFKKIIDI